jgi:threonine synthase
MKAMSSKEGLYVEPASASTFAALRKLAAEGKIDPDESVAMIATGFGSNQPEATIRAWGAPPTIDLDIDAFGKRLTG